MHKVVKILIILLGFADSSAVPPSERGLVRDVKAVYNYVKEKAGKSPVFVYGHSLGTG